MANQGKKQESKRGQRNDTRRCGKASKSNPRHNDDFKSGHTVNGYSAAKIAERADKRENPFKYAVKGLTVKK